MTTGDYIEIGLCVVTFLIGALVGYRTGRK